MQRLKEPDVPQVDFSLQSTGFEELISLPEPKPPELLDIQEDNRKGRLLDSLNKIGGRLEDTSLDFIKRNEMAIGGGLIQGEDLGTREGFRRPEDRKGSVVPGQKDIIKRTSKAAGTTQYQVSINYIDPKLLKQFGFDSPRGEFVKKYTKSFNTLKEAIAHRDKVAYPELAKQIGVDVDFFKNKSKAKTFARNVQEFLPKNKKGYITASQLAEELGEGEKFVTKAGPGRDSSYIKAVKKLLDQTEASQFGFKGTPGQDFYVYKKPTPKEIELLKKYKTLQGSQLETGTGYNLVTPKVAERIKTLNKSDFFKNLMNSKKPITTEMLLDERSDLNKFLSKNNMNLNEFLRAALRYGEALKGDFLINVTDPILSDQGIKPNKKLADNIYKTFQESITGKKGDKIRSAVYKAAMSDISDQLGQQTTTFNNYKTYLRNRANKILGEGKTKKKGFGIDIDEIVGVSSSARNKTAPYAVFSRFVDASLNQNKLSSFQSALSNRTDKLRTAIAKYGPNSKQAKDIVKNFDIEIYKPYMADLKAMGANNVGLPKLTLQGPSSKTLGGGAGRIAELKAQGLDFDEFYKKEKFGYVMPKGSLTQKELLQLEKGDLKGLLNDVRKIACPVGKADGGRISFSDGLDCFNKGVNAINSGNIPEGAGKRNFINFANKALQAGKQAGRGLRTVAKFGILPEMVFVAADTLIRAGSGATFNEAFKKASDFYRTDNAFEKGEALEKIRIAGKDNAEVILNLDNFMFQKNKLDSINQELQGDIALAGNEFNEMNIGMTEDELRKLYMPRIKEQESKVFESSISEPEEFEALAKQTEFEDKRGVLDKQSFFGKPLDALAEVPGIKQAVDFFATDTVQEPNVEIQALSNMFRKQGATDKEIRGFEFAAQKDPERAYQILNAFKELDKKSLPEGEVREGTNLTDEIRKLEFEAAKQDPALREKYFGFSQMPFGETVQQTDLEEGDIPMYDDEQSYKTNRFENFQMNRGIYSIGGRIGFKDGPDNPGRRTFMKLAAGLASIPILGKFFKPAVPLVKKLASSSTVMPDWFPNFVDKFIGRSLGRKIDADLIEFKNPDLPNISMSKNDDGRILIEGKNEYNESWNIMYEPPGYEVIDETTGKAVKTKGEFEAVEGRHVALGPEDYDTDAFYAEDLDDLFTSDIAEMEKYTTGNITKTVKDAFGKDTGLKKGEYDIDMIQGNAENQADILKDEGFDEIN